MNADELFQEGKRWLKEHEKKGFCPKCGKPLPPKKRRWCSKECYEWWWDTFCWNFVRDRILKRDNYTCRICGRKVDEITSKSMSKLTVHHIKPWHIYKDNSDENLITVCSKCHARLHADGNWKLFMESKKMCTLDEFFSPK